MLLFSVFNPDRIRACLSRLMAGSTLCALAVLSVLPASQAQGIPSRDQSVILMHVITSKGAECGLLKAWEVAAIRSMMEQEMRSWSREHRQMIADQASGKLLETGCDAPVVTSWIEAAQPNMEGEMLPGYLLAYQAMAQLETPPDVFTALSLTLDTRPVIAAIEAKLAAMQADGVKPEGGGPWPDYIERTNGRIADMLAGYVSGVPDPKNKPDQVAGMMAQSVLITRLWYDDLKNEEAPE